jgi:aryl-alcohol dehydrogenase-like predicted oxidoreductase
MALRYRPPLPRSTLSNLRSLSMLQAAWDGGIRCFDTVPEYGFGLSEHRVGQFLRQRPRDEFVLSTKVGRLLQTPRGVRSTGRHSGPAVRISISGLIIVTTR